MVIVQVAGQQYTLPQSFADDSMVIADMLNYIGVTRDGVVQDTVIPLEIKTDVWLDYWKILPELAATKDYDDKTNNSCCFTDRIKTTLVTKPVLSVTKPVLSVNTISSSWLALPSIKKLPNDNDNDSDNDDLWKRLFNIIYVIDLLDNRQQLRSFYNYIFNSYNCDLTVINHLLRSTNFKLDDIDPFLTTKTIGEMIPLLKDKVGLSRIYASHIYSTLYEQQMTTAEINACFFHVKLSTLHFYNQAGTSSRLAIRCPPLSRFVCLYGETQPEDGDIKYPIKISNRIASYYREGERHIYYARDSNGKQVTVICHRHYPILRKKLVHCSCSGKAGCKHKLEHFCTGENWIPSTTLDFVTLVAINYILPAETDYIPLSANSTNLTLGRYTVQTYNLLSLDSDGYYRLLVYEVDPIARVLYAFAL